MPASDDDRELAAAFRDGDERVLRAVYDRYGPLVYRVALASLPTQSDAEEVTQATFVSAWQGRATYNVEAGSLGAWLVGIVRRRAIDRLRSIGRERLAQLAAESRHRNRPRTGTGRDRRTPRDRRRTRAAARLTAAGARAGLLR